MLTAYLNYPNPHVTIHTDNGCATIQQQHKQNQRVIRLNQKTLSAELERFENKYYRFGADQETNDMWLYVDFLNPTFERAIVEYVRSLLGVHYSPFSRVTINEHC
jgi:hypothetical protein